MLFHLSKPITGSSIPHECAYIDFPSLGFFLYDDPNTDEPECFAISNDSKE